MKQWLLTTKSDSGDDYFYFINNDIKPTLRQLRMFLEKNAHDKGYENIDVIVEIKDFLDL